MLGVKRKIWCTMIGVSQPPSPSNARKGIVTHPGRWSAIFVGGDWLVEGNTEWTRRRLSA